ncbi:hypothetical protein G6F65_012579 [Rhizopus arrhizus]|nr:hypothetical protein G6F65_012579 [Rhizopus arrhizus]
MGVVEPGQVIAEIGEVVAHADAEITPDIAVDTGQPTLPAAAVAHVQQAVLQQPMPLVVQVVTQLAGGEVGGRVEPRTVDTVDLPHRRQVIQVAVTAEQRPAIVVPRAIGEAEVALDETRARHRIDRIIGVGVVEARRDPPAVVEAMTQAVGADPLRASLRAGVAAPFQLALPFGTRRGPPAGQAHRLAVDLPGAGVELAVAQREAGVPAYGRIEIHAEGVR